MSAKRRKRIQDTGIGLKSRLGARPFINQDGSSNVIYKNAPKGVNSLYSFLIEISWSLFFLWVTIGYIILNLIFASLYMLIGVEELMTPSNSFIEDFVNAFYFSAQTITTVGYGAISPGGVMSGLVSSFEALIGLLSFSFITGLLYGRFSRPRAGVEFSEQLLVRPFKEGKALMFRLMSSRSSIMIEPEVSCTFALHKKNKKGEITRQFFLMNLDVSKIHYLPSMWTLVHEIKEGSPLFGIDEEKMLTTDFELYVMVKYYDNTYAQQVYQLRQYSNKDLEINRQFVPSYLYDKEGFLTVDQEDLSKTIPINET